MANEKFSELPVAIALSGEEIFPIVQSGVNKQATLSLVTTGQYFTTGSVPFAGSTGALTQDNSHLFWDDTNNRLGIGTITPISALSVAGNAALQASAYLNWGATAGSSGYGIRDNSGVIEVKDSGGSWATPGTGSVASGTSGQLSYYASTGATVSGNANLNVSAGALTVGIATSVIGQLKLAGNTSGTATITPQATAGTPTLTLPNASGTFAVSATSPLAVSATTGNLTITGSALSKTDDTNVTLTLGGTPTTALLAATSLTLGWTGTLAASRGGTGLSSLGTGVATWLGTPSSANLASAITDETGSGALVFGTAPTIVGGSVTALTTLSIRDTSAAFNVELRATSSSALTANRVLTLNIFDSNSFINLYGPLILAFDASFSVISGGNTTILRVTGSTDVTLPTTGTLVNSAVTTLSSLASVGTITTGAWTGSVIGSAYGGTGVANNAASTLTISGNFGTTITVSGTTSVTLPTSGTLVNSAVTTLSSLASVGTMTTGAINWAGAITTSGVISTTNATASSSTTTGAAIVTGGVGIGGALYVGGGLQVGAPTGGDKGAGTANFAADIYKNNTAYTNPDFVFERAFTGKIEKYADSKRAKDYRGALDLDALAAYVRDNLRLPRITDEPAGMFERGDIVLEKLEEAYLYIMQLHDRVTRFERSSSISSASLTAN